MTTIILPNEVTKQMQTASYAEEIRNKKILCKHDMAFLLGNVSLSTVGRKTRQGALPPPNNFGLWNKYIIERRLSA